MSSPYLPSLSRTRSHRSVFVEEFSSTDSSPYPDVDLSNMATSPTPRDIRRLASDHDFVFGAHPTPRRLGWWPFIATHLSLPAALVAGIIFVIVAIVYTSELSKQLLECPQWANSCQRADDWTINNLGTVQGIITMVYMIGMAALAYTALGLCEATVWPLMRMQWFTIKGLNAYLLTIRSSVMSAPAAIMAVRSLAAGVVLVCALAVTLLPFAAPPLVGHAYSPTSQTVELESNYTLGGGITELYAQTNPPTSVMVQVMAKYNAWAMEPLSEPMPTYRDWYIDREVLHERGNFTANAARLRTSISCRPHRVEQLNRDNLWWNAFRTNLTRTSNPTQTGETSTNAEVWIRPHAQLTLWVDNFEFVSNHTRSTLIFAALNGTIEGGSSTPLILGNLTTVSSVACDVDVEAVDDVLSIGNTSIPSSTTMFPVLSSTGTLTVSPDASQRTQLNELLLWFTVAPLLTGASVDGTQPMFTNSSATGMPLAHTASTSPTSDSSNTWTIPGLETFIRLSIGALAQSTIATSPSLHNSPIEIEITTTTQTRKLAPARALLLLIPPLAVLALTVALAIYSAGLHARMAVPVMRLAVSDLGEMLKSTQTRWAHDVVGADAAKPYLPHELGLAGVRFDFDEDGVAGFVGADKIDAGAGAAEGKPRNGLGRGVGMGKGKDKAKGKEFV
ncbi:hypothetical protein VTI28DRAFT_6409 [Corynascus sepedonium]